MDLLPRRLEVVGVEVAVKTVKNFRHGIQIVALVPQQLAKTG